MEMSAATTGLYVWVCCRICIQYSALRNHL